MDVKLPDGTILRGVPDGMSKADLVAKLKTNGYDTSGLEPNAANVLNREDYQRQVDARKGEGPGFFEKGGSMQNIAGGLVRGAGSIGSTAMRVLPNALGGDTADENAQRRAQMDAGLSTIGANPDSMAFKGGKLAAEIAGTAGAGGVVANGLSKVPVIANSAPALINAIRTSGMSTGSPVAAGTANALRDLAIRAGGGAVSGGITAGMVNPEDAGMGAAIGGAAPVVLKAAGLVGNKIGQVVRGPEQSQDTIAAVKAARDAGYVIPPTQAKPTLANRVLEGFSGKLTTAQNASAKNAEVTNGLAAKAIGLAPDTKLTPEVLNDVRKAAGQAYEAVAELPIKPGAPADTLTNAAASAEVNPRSMVFDLRKARNDATAWFNSYARTADPDALAKANAAKSAATQLQKSLEDYATSVGRDDLVPAMVESRKLIAKTWTVEKALNQTTGTVDARKLGAMLEKGKPLSNELKQAAEFANRFPKAAQTVEKMGSLPQSSPLDWAASGAISAATSNPLMLAGVAARPAARALVLSGMVQNRLASQGGENAILKLMGDPNARQFLYRSAPVAASR